MFGALLRFSGSVSILPDILETGPEIQTVLSIGPNSFQDFHTPSCHCRKVSAKWGMLQILFLMRLPVEKGSQHYAERERWNKVSLNTHCGSLALWLPKTRSLPERLGEQRHRLEEDLAKFLS